MLSPAGPCCQLCAPSELHELKQAAVVEHVKALREHDPNDEMGQASMAEQDAFGMTVQSPPDVQAPEEKVESRSLDEGGGSSSLREAGGLVTEAGSEHDAVGERQSTKERDITESTEMKSIPSGSFHIPRVLESKFLPERIRRFAKLSTVLRNFGSFWMISSLASSDGAADAKLFELSHQVDSSDAFLSHDWGSSGVGKFLALCIIFNGKAAFIGSMIAGLCACALQQLKIIPKLTKGQWVLAGETHLEDLGCCVQLATIFTYTFILLFWQRIKRSFNVWPTYAFMDRLCIHQTDSKLKQEGILALSAFLNMSKKLVILWSPRYFSRLWCAYELASWTVLNRKSSDIEFFPISFVFALLAYMVWFVCQLGSFVLAALIDPTSTFYRNLLTVVMSAIPLTVACHFATKSMLSLNQLPEQLASFSMSKAQCFCCSVNHNFNGKQIDCDKELVSSTLRPLLASRAAIRSSFKESMERSSLRTVRSKRSSMDSTERSSLRSSGQGTTKLDRRSIESTTESPGGTASITAQRGSTASINAQQSLERTASITSQVFDEEQEFDPLDAFDDYVRNKVASEILQKVGGTQITYSLVLKTVVVFELAFCLDFIDFAFVANGWQFWLYLVIVSFCTVPLSVKVFLFSCYLSARIDHRLYSSATSSCNCLRSTIRIIVSVSIFLGFMLPLAGLPFYVSSKSSSSYWFGLAVFKIALTMFLYVRRQDADPNADEKYRFVVWVRLLCGLVAVSGFCSVLQIMLKTDHPIGADTAYKSGSSLALLIGCLLILQGLGKLSFPTGYFRDLAAFRLPFRAWPLGVWFIVVELYSGPVLIMGGLCGSFGSMVKLAAFGAFCDISAYSILSISVLVRGFGYNWNFTGKPGKVCVANCTCFGAYGAQKLTVWILVQDFVVMCETLFVAYRISQGGLL